LIQRLNVKIGAPVAVRNVAYYIYRWTKVSKEQHQKPVALFAILSECKQIATHGTVCYHELRKTKAKQKTHMALSVILKTNANKEENKKKHMWHGLLSWTNVRKEQNKKHMSHCLLSWTNVSKEQSKRRVALFVFMNEGIQRAKQKRHVALFVITIEGKQRAKQSTRYTICYLERM
jgi:hypothetical protein